MFMKLEDIHPGEILLKEFIIPLNLTQKKLAKELNVPYSRINAIVNGKREITANSAIKLAEYFKTSEKFWMNLQSNYDLKKEKDKIYAKKIN